MHNPAAKHITDLSICIWTRDQPGRSGSSCSTQILADDLRSICL